MSETEKKKAPAFKSEAEEAQWHWDHRDEMREYLKPKPKNPVPLHERLGLPPLNAPEPQPAKLTSIRLEPEVIDMAKAVASHYHMGYQTLLKKLIKDGLTELKREIESA